MKMKKVLAIVLAAIIVMALAACSANTGKDDNKDNDSASSTSGTINVDMSKYPADFKDWTAQNLADYFNEAVNFPSDCETWIQDHAEYWANTPVYEISGIWNADGADDVIVMFTVFNSDGPDTTPEEVEAIQNAIREDKNHDYTTEDLMLGIQDHMIGHVSFSYGFTTTNEEVYNEVEAAYNNLVEAMGVTPDF